MATQAATSTIDREEVEQFSRIAAEWWDETGKFAPLHRLNPLRIGYIRARIEQHFGHLVNGDAPFRNLRLADIGCGGGLLCEPMARLGASVTGIDASATNIGVASTHAQSMGLIIDYRATTAEDLAATAAQFDVVLALEIIEHVADLDLFYDSLVKLVKPGGLLIMSTINRTAKAYAMAIIGAEYVLRWLPAGTHDWKKFVRPSEMAAALATRSLTVTDTKGMIFHPLSWKFSLSDTDLDVNYLLTAEKPA